AFRRTRAPVLRVPHRQMERQLVLQVAFQLPPLPQSSPPQPQIRQQLAHLKPPSPAPRRYSTAPTPTPPPRAACVPPLSFGRTSPAGYSSKRPIHWRAARAAPVGVVPDKARPPPPAARRPTTSGCAPQRRTHVMTRAPALSAPAC